MARCEPKARYDDKWLRKACECLEHTFSEAWQRITGDSYVVDVREVTGSDASYLAKYVAKSFYYAGVFRDLGFHRSWSRSRSWGVERLRLERSVEDRWVKVEFTSGQEVAHGLIGYSSWEEWIRKGEKSHLRARVGTELARELQEKREDEAAKTEILRMMEVLRDSDTKYNVIGNGGSGR